MLKLFDKLSCPIIILEGEKVIYTNHRADQINRSVNLLEIIGSSEVLNQGNHTYNIHRYFVVLSKKKYQIIELQDVDYLRRIEEKVYCYEAIFDKLDDGLMMSDKNGRIILYNPAQEKLEGLARENCMGKYLWDVYQYEAPEMSEHRQVFKSQKPIINEYKSHVKNGQSEKYLSYSTYPVIHDNQTLSVFSVSKNESKLLELLSETLELKRKLKNKAVSKTFNNGTFYTFDDIKGNSPAMTNTIKEAERMSLIDGNLLIIGETGVGKEMFAQSIHNMSKHNKEKFFAVNCAALPENLLESTLFGTTKGSFTGSIDQDGYLEEVGKGTLFLDELNSLPIYMQTKLLRVFQEKKFRKVGGLKNKDVECRIICAINEDPETLLSEGRLRQDLYFRISRLCLFIPPLRERPMDIVFLTNFFINKYNEILDKNIKGYSNDLRELLYDYVWPGNVRELEHVIENLVINTEASESELSSSHLPNYLKSKLLKEENKTRKNEGSLPETLNEVERKIIVEALNRFNWNFTRTSAYLGIIRQSLIYRVKKLDITKDKDLWV
ncbi:MAG: sigma 54-interacting transcriptional regulator [Dethiosulfatibacter sp.]|nr:sigma 54-interacting transcriptional regulator [Dethiosulfatibacter sp.]